MRMAVLQSSVSLREVELMMAHRRIHWSCETIRRWCDTFGSSYAAKLKRRRPKLGDKWFLDEVFLKINRVQHDLWRAVDQHDAVIDILVQPKRDRFAAMRFFRKLLEASRRRPRVIITDKLRRLWRREETNPAASDASTESVLEQSGPELTSADPATGAPQEAL